MLESPRASPVVKTAAPIENRGACSVRLAVPSFSAMGASGSRDRARVVDRGSRPARGGFAAARGLVIISSLTVFACDRPAEPRLPSVEPIPAAPWSGAAASVPGDALGASDTADDDDDRPDARPASTIDAAPLAIPPGLQAATPWIGRVFRTGAIVPVHTHETFTLRRDRTAALLTIVVQEDRSSGGVLGNVGSWSTVATTQYVGTAVERAGGVIIAVANANEQIELRCTRTRLRAARADAVREPAPLRHGGEDCGDEGRWVPAGTRPVDAIRCLPAEGRSIAPDDDSTWPNADHLALAPAPGIEWLYVNDDCTQGGGWRRVPADGSIARGRR